MNNRRFPPSWSVEELDACHVVRDHDGPAARLRLFRGGTWPALSAKLLSNDRIAKLPGLLRKP
jgi:hypothetical protein